MDIVKKLEKKIKIILVLWMIKVKIKKYECMMIDFLI